MQVIDLNPKRAERLSFEEFLALTETDRQGIAKTRIVLPAFGGSLEDAEQSFGEIEVIFKHPAIYSAHFDNTAIFNNGFGRWK